MHESTGTESVGAVIGKIRFTDYKQPGHIVHQVVIDPQAAHRVMNGGVDPHRHFVGVFAGDLFIDFEQISVALPDCMFSQPLDCVGKIEIDAATAWANAPAFVTNFLCRARRNIARRKIAVARIFSLEIIIALVIRDLVRRFAAIFLVLWNPDAAIIAQRFRHQRQL